MAKAPGDKPASRGFLSSLGTLVLALMLVAFGFWAGRTFETIWPSNAPAPPASVAVATLPASPLATTAPSASATPSAEPPPAPSAPPETTAGEVVAADPARRPAARRGGSRRAPAGSQPAGVAPAPEPVPVAPLLPGRPFVFGAGLVESLKTTAPEVPGFETSGVGVKRAPEVPGRVDFEVSPKSVKPGDRYAVKVFLVNDGGKDIAIDALNVAMVADGKRSARAMPSKARSVAPKSRALLAELPGVWQDGVATWALEVAVTSRRQDRYTNTLNWK